MISVVKGDLFESRAQTLVNTVNCVGVMGKGIALGFRKRFPEMYEDYVKRCAQHDVRLGEPYLYRTLVTPWILNFPTKDHWRSVAKLSDITAGLEYLTAHYKDWGITSLAVPPLGCGEGKLEWQVVGPTLHRFLAGLDADVELYAPFNTPESELDTTFLSEHAITESLNGVPVGLPASSVALAAILRMIEREPYHWPVGRIMFQKIAYFAQEAGIPTGLDYRRSSYGPFAEGLKRVTSTLVNNGVVEERRSGRMFIVETGSTYPDAVRRYKQQLESWRPAIEKVVDLLIRADTNRSEVLASAHFAAQVLSARSKLRSAPVPTENDVVHEVSEWKINRKPPLDSTEIASAVRALSMLGWIEVQSSIDLPIEHDLLEVTA